MAYNASGGSLPEGEAMELYQSLGMLIINTTVLKPSEKLQVLNHCVFLQKYIAAIETLVKCIDDLPKRAAADEAVNVFKSNLKFSWVTQLETTRLACAEQVKKSQALFESLSSRRVGLPAHHLYREPYPLGAYYYHSRRAP